MRRRPDQRDPLTNLINTRSTELQRNTDGVELMAKQTGGFVVSNKNDFGFERVFEDQSGYYLIGYRPREHDVRSSLSYDLRRASNAEA